MPEAATLSRGAAPDAPDAPLTALLIPVDGPLQEVELDGSLDQLQALVGGNIEAVPLPDFIDGARRATAYIHEEGKFECPLNLRATDFMVPGSGLRWGDFIAGPFLLCGFNPEDGDHGPLPAAVARRARKIEREAG